MGSRRRVLQQTLAWPTSWVGLPLTALANIVPSTPGRTALVIGNERYPHNPLSSAANDARAMAALLTQAGFAVDLQLNATRAQMAAAIGALGKSAAGRDAGTVLFYYAGHAAQLDWRNYLLPVDGNVNALGDVRKQCIDLGLLLGHLGRTRGKTALIVLDACRDDPFGPRLRLPQKGMSQYDAPPGTLLAFATAPGSVAIEVVGSANGLYTEHLLRELPVRGVRIEDALKRVRLNVRLASGGRQVPWESTSLESDVYLFPAPRLSEAELERQLREELEAWNRIKASSNPSDWIAYLRQFPNGKFSEAAQVRMRRLLAAKEAAHASSSTGRAPALLLGPNRPVPTRFKGSGNPHSAGTYSFRPVWTAGDEYVYDEIDLYSRVVKRRHTIVIKRVDTANNRVELNGGSSVDLMGGAIDEAGRRRYEPAIQINPAELQVGRKWSSRFQQSGTEAGVGEYDFRITRRQDVKVPAGTFAAFRIEGLGSFKGRPLHLTRWVVPGINLSVRSEARQSGSARVLVSARQAVSA
jgi:Caspase domain